MRAWIAIGTVACTLAFTACKRSKCNEIRARFDARLERATNACSSDADCGCYNPVGGEKLGCGGVTDVAAARELASIEKEFHAVPCEWTHQCGSQVCTPKCESGRCR
jgi:hypothetical protein